MAHKNISFSFLIPINQSIRWFHIHWFKLRTFPSIIFDILAIFVRIFNSKNLSNRKNFWNSFALYWIGNRLIEFSLANSVFARIVSLKIDVISIGESIFFIQNDNAHLFIHSVFIYRAAKANTDFMEINTSISEIKSYHRFDVVACLSTVRICGFRYSGMFEKNAAICLDLMSFPYVLHRKW